MALHPESKAALTRLRKKRGAKKKLVFVSGNFNVIHPGHLRLLKFAADCGDVLVVGVNNREGGAAVVPGELRLEGVRAIGMVDHAFLLHDSPEQFIAALQPAIVVKGKEHETARNPEKKVVEGYGGQLLFSSGDVVFSSLDLIQREFKEFNLSSISKPLDFPARHGFALSDLKAVLVKFAGLRVLVIGDLIVDEYLACDALGMSQEDPAIVVTPVLSERFVGGAGIVASHAAGLGADASMVSLVGYDEAAAYAAEKLPSYGVEATLLSDASRPTTLKQRYRAAGKTLLRVSHLKQHAADQALQERMLKAIKAALPKADLLIFADFNYGCLPQPLVDAIVTLCGQRKVPMAADSQSSSQVGDVSRFKNALLLTPTEREARLALRDFDSGLVVLAEALRQRTNAQNIVLTLDSEGVLLHAPSARAEGWLTDRLPALNLAPRDTAGAGDSLLVAAALALVTGADMWRSAYIGSIAAACQVGRIGNTPLARGDIEREIDS